jgi:hypothetical protein
MNQGRIFVLLLYWYLFKLSKSHRHLISSETAHMFVNIVKKSNIENAAYLRVILLKMSVKPNLLHLK